jgi:hypothetical protein
VEVPVIIGAYLRIGIGTQVQVGPTSALTATLTATVQAI